jgi:hypothetical protein
MGQSTLLRVNFTLSPAAKRAAEALRREYDARFPDDPAAVLSISWGYVEGTDPYSGRVMVGYYQQSQLPDVAHGIQQVSGVKFVYFTIDKFHRLFEGKVLDHTDDRGFFLREP